MVLVESYSSKCEGSLGQNGRIMVGLLPMVAFDDYVALHHRPCGPFYVQSCVMLSTISILTMFVTLFVWEVSPDYEMLVL